MKKFGVPLVEKPADMIGKVDGMLIEAVDGTVHYERAKPFLEAGIPCFIDKPFTCSVADAKKIVELADEEEGCRSSRRRRCATRRKWSSTSPTRSQGKLVGCAVYGPASLSPIPERNAGLFHYGIHAVEMLYTLMGPGCKRVTCDAREGRGRGDRARGRTAAWRRSAASATARAATVSSAFAEKGVKAVTVGTGVHLPRIAEEDRRVLQDGQVAGRTGR